MTLSIQKAMATLRAGLSGSEGPETSYLGHNTVDMLLWVGRRAQRTPACEKEPSEAEQWLWASKNVDSCGEESIQEGQKLHLVLQKSSGM